jgi:hypothetical protein
MRKNQLTRGKERRVMYVENKDGDIDGVPARIGWVSFSRTGLTIYYRGRTLTRGGICGNYYDLDRGEDYWVSGVKERGSNVHWAEPTTVCVDPDRVRS